MVTNKDAAEIVVGIMNLSNQLGLRVVAEGIEHEDQYAHLRALNCHAGQGNLHDAVAQYEAYRAVMRDELDLEPSPRMEELISELGLVVRT